MAYEEFKEYPIEEWVEPASQDPTLSNVFLYDLKDAKRYLQNEQTQEKTIMDHLEKIDQNKNFDNKAIPRHLIPLTTFRNKHQKDSLTTEKEMRELRRIKMNVEKMVNQLYCAENPEKLTQYITDINKIYPLILKILRDIPEYKSHEVIDKQKFSVELEENKKNLLDIRNDLYKYHQITIALVLEVKKERGKEQQRQLQLARDELEKHTIACSLIDTYTEYQKMIAEIDELIERTDRVLYRQEHDQLIKKRKNLVHIINLYANTIEKDSTIRKHSNNVTAILENGKNVIRDLLLLKDEVGETCRKLNISINDDLDHVYTLLKNELLRINKNVINLLSKARVIEKHISLIKIRLQESQDFSLLHGYQQEIKNLWTYYWNHVSNDFFYIINFSAENKTDIADSHKSAIGLLLNQNELLHKDRFLDANVVSRLLWKKRIVAPGQPKNMELVTFLVIQYETFHARARTRKTILNVLNTSVLDLVFSFQQNHFEKDVIKATSKWDVDKLLNYDFLNIGPIGDREKRYKWLEKAMVVLGANEKGWMNDFPEGGWQKLKTIEMEYQNDIKKTEELHSILLGFYLFMKNFMEHLRPGNKKGGLGPFLFFEVEEADDQEEANDPLVSLKMDFDECFILFDHHIESVKRGYKFKLKDAPEEYFNEIISDFHHVIRMWNIFFWKLHFAIATVCQRKLSNLSNFVYSLLDSAPDSPISIKFKKDAIDNTLDLTERLHNEYAREIFQSNLGGPGGEDARYFASREASSIYEKTKYMTNNNPAFVDNESYATSKHGQLDIDKYQVLSSVTTWSFLPIVKQGNINIGNYFLATTFIVLANSLIDFYRKTKFTLFDDEKEIDGVVVLDYRLGVDEWDQHDEKERQTCVTMNKHLNRLLKQFQKWLSKEKDARITTKYIPSLELPACESFVSPLSWIASAMSLARAFPSLRDIGQRFEKIALPTKKGVSRKLSFNTPSPDKIQSPLKTPPRSAREAFSSIIEKTKKSPSPMESPSNNIAFNNANNRYQTPMKRKSPQKILETQGPPMSIYVDTEEDLFVKEISAAELKYQMELSRTIYYTSPSRNNVLSPKRKEKLAEDARLAMQKRMKNLAGMR